MTCAIVNSAVDDIFGLSRWRLSEHAREERQERNRQCRRGNCLDQMPISQRRFGADLEFGELGPMDYVGDYVG